MSDHDRNDNDLPFNLPIEPGYEDNFKDNIHKIDTEDIEIPVEMARGMTEPRVDDEDAAEIARLHAQDPPLQRPAPEDDSMMYRSGDMERTEPRQVIDEPPLPRDGQYTTDNDVPFYLPKEPQSKPSKGNVSNKWVTMPGDPARKNEPEATVQRMPRVQPTVQNQPRVQAPVQSQYQRPAPQQARPNIPPAPSNATPGSRPSQPQRALPRKRRKRSGLSFAAIFIGLFVTFCGGITFLTVGGGVLAYISVGNLLNEQLDALDDYSNFQSTFIYDRNGQPLFEVFNEGRRTNVSLDEMPDNLINATIAIEDDSFYSNIGIDIGATFVATLAYLGAEPDENTPGGSTITQQLVRNVLFPPEKAAERSVERKVEEIGLAIALNARKGKDEILELYLNEIYYGNLAYGAQAAAQIFFGKDVGDLTLGEAAMLAGLPQAPAELDPLSPDPDVQAAVTQRWIQVLDEMVEESYITQADRDAAISAGLRFSSPNIDLRAPHFTVYAQAELEELMLSLGYSPEEITRGGLKVFTTVDLQMNEQVQAIAAQQIRALDPSKNVSNAAVVVLKPLTGEILSMVGSIDYNNDAIDGRVNVTDRPRQPGSTMKPFTYAAAMELGFTPGDVIWDTRVVVPQPGQADYIPRNYDGAFHGPMRMRYALANSYNIPAIQTMRFVGVDYLLAMMQRLGVDSLGLDASRYGISLTLGGGEVTLLELTRAYSVFANEGLLVDSTSILCVLDNENNILYEYENSCPLNFQNRSINRTAETISRTGLGTPVLDDRVSFVISDMMADNASRTPEMGANSPLRTPNIDTSVKTGTTNDVKDNWTVGYTRNLAVGVWVGNNNGDPMRNTSGLTGAAPIWNQVMTTIYENSTWMNEFRVDGQRLPDRQGQPGGLTLNRLCDVRALFDPATGCSSQTNEYLLDFPARLPDGNGNLVDQPRQQNPQQVAPTSGSFVELAEPGIYTAAVMPLDPSIGNAIQFNVAPGEPSPPPPRYCRVPVELMDAARAVQQLYFIAPPLVPRDAVEAEIYAQSRGLAFLPTIDCTADLVNAVPVNAGPSVVTAVVTSPQPNQTITGSIPILGSAQLGGGALYYKLEIVGGDWTDWITLSDVVYDSVVNGQLGTLPALQPGSYRLRLVIVGADGNFLQQPYEVPFNVPQT